MQEGLLARVAASPFAKRLILKGGFLLFASQQAAGRTTKDIDFLGEGISNEPKELAKIFAAVASIKCNDGLSFDTQLIRSERITEMADYHGVRLHLTGRLGAVRNTLQVDVGFGDAVEGGPRRDLVRISCHVCAQGDRYARATSRLFSCAGVFRDDADALERFHPAFQTGRSRPLARSQRHQDEARTSLFEVAGQAELTTTRPLDRDDRLKHHGDRRAAIPDGIASLQ